MATQIGPGRSGLRGARAYALESTADSRPSAGSAAAAASATNGMKLTTQRRIDRFVGIPACAVLTALVRLREGFRPLRVRAARPRRVLFIELSEMGSTILASAAMRHLQERY